MKKGKRAKLPRGPRWKSDSPFIWFSWRDARGKQHQKNTETADPAKALGIKLEFLAREQQEIEQIKTLSEDTGKVPLSRVADLYFEWKAASSAASTIERERRIFNSVRKFFGSQLQVKAIRLPMIQQYQQQRRQHVSKTMKQPVTARSVNYEMQPLRNMLNFAHCWMGDLAAGYKPLRQVKSRIGKYFVDQPLCRINQRGIDFGSLFPAELFKGTVSHKGIQDLPLIFSNPALKLRYRLPNRSAAAPTGERPLVCHCCPNPLNSRRMERCTILLAKRASSLSHTLEIWL